MELILIRHGLPVRKQTTDGKPADPPLSEIGLQQAQLVAESLKDIKLDKIYSSPMRRAFQTAEPLSELKSLDIEINDGIAEYDRHSDVYIPVEELKEIDYDAWLRLMRDDSDDDFKKFAATVCQSIEGIISDNKGKRVALACHGGVINVWASYVLGMDAKMFFNPNYTSVNRFMAASSGEKSLVTLNEHTHLL